MRKRVRVATFSIVTVKIRVRRQNHGESTNRGRRAWYLLRGWWCRSSPDKNIVPRRSFSPSARKSSGSRSPDTGWNGSPRLAMDKPCCPCTCNNQSDNLITFAKNSNTPREPIASYFFSYCLFPFTPFLRLNINYACSAQAQSVRRIHFSLILRDSRSIDLLGHRASPRSYSLETRTHRYGDPRGVLL